MSKFDRVLSDKKIKEIAEILGLQGGIDGVVIPLARAVEHATQAKLHKQEPVAVVASDFQLMYRGGAAISEIEGLKVGMVLYAHPMPCVSHASDKTACVSEKAESDTQSSSQVNLDSSNHIADMRKMVTPLAQRKIQTLLDKGEYRAIENATVLVNGQGHAAIVNRGGAFYWVDNEALAREFDGRAMPVEASLPGPKKKVNLSLTIDTKEVQALLQSYLNSLEGWQLVPVEPDQALLVSMATCLNHGFGLLTKESQELILYDMRKLYDEMVGKGYYSQENRERYLAMLAAAPKYTEGK